MIRALLQCHDFTLGSAWFRGEGYVRLSWALFSMVRPSPFMSPFLVTQM